LIKHNTNSSRIEASKERRMERSRLEAREVRRATQTMI
jgi:hypothetical protein